MIEDCFKNQSTTCNSTADGSSVSSIGKATLHLHIANFKFPIPSSYVTIYQTHYIVGI